MGEAYDDRGRVFANECGEWVRPNRLCSTVNSYGRHVGYDGMSLRSLRHFHASVALRTGQNIVSVSEHLGHANVPITSDIYAASLHGWQEQAAGAFAQAMQGESTTRLVKRRNRWSNSVTRYMDT